MSARKVAVVGVPQTRGMRYIAMPRSDFLRLKADPALIDSVTVLGCLDVEADGARTWARTGPLYQAIQSDVREALREAAR